MILSISLLILGLGCLVLGAHWLVLGASSLAKRFNVPEIVIGLTVVAFGTSTPELIVNIVSSIKGSADIAFGNVIGSNNFNILIILGISAVIFPLTVKRNTTWKEIPFALLVSIAVLALVNDHWFVHTHPNTLTRLDGAILLGIFALFLAYNWKLSINSIGEEPSKVKSYSLFITIGSVAMGLGALILGGKLVVSSAVTLANFFGVSQKVIGLTIVAAGTSLPELATSAVAAFKKHPDIAVGNIIGSNIFNLLLILGISALIHPLSYQSSFNTDFYLMLFATFVLFVFMFIPRRHSLDRWQGGFLIGIYVLYTVFLLK